MISYKYGKCRPIGQSLVKYNTVLRSLANASTKSLTSECATVCLPITNLDFITHTGLRSLMRRGFNFRETLFVKSSRYLFVLKGYIKKFVSKWAKKEKQLPPYKLTIGFTYLVILSSLN